MSQISPEQQWVLIKCQHCRAQVREDRMKRHLQKVHTPLPLGVIKISPAKRKVANITEIRSRQPEPSSIGFKVMEGLRMGQRWTANSSRTCSECRGRIIFLDIGVNQQKAFDVADDKAIVGTHACNENARSESIYTISGGIVDSNRRRH